MRWEDFRSSENVEDRRGMGMPGGAGGLGIGTVIILGLIGWVLGIHRRILIGGAEMVSRGSPTQSASQGKQGVPDDQTGRFVSAILGNTEDVWKEVLPSQVNRAYRRRSWSCSRARRARAAARRSRRWDRSTVRSTRTSTSTCRSSRKCSGGSGSAATSPRPT